MLAKRESFPADARIVEITSLLAWKFCHLFQKNFWCVTSDGLDSWEHTAKHCSSYLSYILSLLRVFNMDFINRIVYLHIALFVLYILNFQVLPFECFPLNKVLYTIWLLHFSHKCHPISSQWLFVYFLFWHTRPLPFMLLVRSMVGASSEHLGSSKRCLPMPYSLTSYHKIKATSWQFRFLMLYGELGFPFHLCTSVFTDIESDLTFCPFCQFTENLGNTSKSILFSFNLIYE